VKKVSFRIRYFIANWKLILHLLFRTKRFGVNNEWWSEFDSIFGWSNKEKLKAALKIKPIIRNYRMMYVRSALGFIPWYDFMMIVPKRQFKRMYPDRDYNKEISNLKNLT